MGDPAGRHRVAGALGAPRSLAFELYPLPVALGQTFPAVAVEDLVLIPQERSSCGSTPVRLTCRQRHTDITVATPISPSKEA